MGKERMPHVGRPFGTDITQQQMNDVFQATGNLRTISTAWPLLIENTALGGVRLRIDPKAFATPQVQQPAVDTFKFGYVLSTALPRSPEMVLFQPLDYEVTEHDGDIKLVEWTKKGDARIVIVPANFKGVDFEELADPTFTNKTPTMRVDKLGSRWVVTWIPRWVVRGVPSNATIVRCP